MIQEEKNLMVKPKLVKPELVLPIMSANNLFKRKLVYMLILGVLLIVVLFNSTSCVITEKVSIIAPSGTPSLIISKTLYEKSDLVDYKIVKGADSLVAGFTKADEDIIIAPINLGAKFANTIENFEYVMYRTIVWCNYYVVSKTPINSINDLDNQEITVFGKNSTPDVVFSTLVNYHQITPIVNYVNDVETANSLFLYDKANIIISAEPALSVLLTKGTYYTYSLEDAWKEMTSSDLDIPQAAIFVKKTSLSKLNVMTIVKDMVEKIEHYEDQKAEIVECAKIIDQNLNSEDDIYISALPRCNYKIDHNEKSSIEYYFNQVIALNLGQTVGGKLPNEEFYYQE